MTTIEKNVEIAKLLDFKTNSQKTHWKFKGLNNSIFNELITDIHNGWLSELLKFHSNAEWQLGAIEYIESLGYAFEYCNKQCRIYDNKLSEGWTRERLCPVKENTAKEAIFECLFQFSQYIKPLNNE